MQDDEFRARIDRHMARADEVVREIRDEVALTRHEVELTREEVRLSREQRERSDAMLERHGAMLDRHNAWFDRHEAEHADIRDFMKQLIARVERSGRDVSLALAAQSAELRRLGTETSELKAESRAHTSALLKLLDRLDGPTPGGAAGSA